MGRFGPHGLASPRAPIYRPPIPVFSRRLTPAGPSNRPHSPPIPRPSAARVLRSLEQLPADLPAKHPACRPKLRLQFAVPRLTGRMQAQQFPRALWPKARPTPPVRCEIFNALCRRLSDGCRAQHPSSPKSSLNRAVPGSLEILRLAVLSDKPSLEKSRTPPHRQPPSAEMDDAFAVHFCRWRQSPRRSSREDDLRALAAALDGPKKPPLSDFLAALRHFGKSVDFLVAEALKKSPQTLPAASLAVNRLKIPGLDQRLAVEQAKAAPSPEVITLLAFRKPGWHEALPPWMPSPRRTPQPSSAGAALSCLENHGPSSKRGAQLLRWIAETPARLQIPSPTVLHSVKSPPRMSAEATTLAIHVPHPGVQAAPPGVPPSATLHHSRTPLVPSLEPRLWSGPRSGYTDLRSIALTSWCHGFEYSPLATRLLAAAQISDFDDPAAKTSSKAAAKLLPCPNIKASALR